MNFSNENHPHTNELLMAVTDRSDLPARLKQHLDQCGSCAAKVDELESAFIGIGRNALKFSPEPVRRPYILPVRRIALSWRPALVTALTLILVFAGAWWAFRSPSSVEPDSDNGLTAEALWEDEAFMTEISSLSENALPSEFMDLLEESDLEETPEPTPPQKTDSNQWSFFNDPAMKGIPRC